MACALGVAASADAPEKSRLSFIASMMHNRRRASMVRMVICALLVLASAPVHAQGPGDETVSINHFFSSDAPGTPEGSPLSSNSPDRAADGRLVKKNHVGGGPGSFSLERLFHDRRDD